MSGRPFFNSLLLVITNWAFNYYGLRQFFVPILQLR